MHQGCKPLRSDSKTQTMRKVTTGFKCDPDLKADLEYYAVEYGITLSSFIEQICSDHIHSLYHRSEELEESEYSDIETESEYEALLTPLFQKFNGQTLDMKLPDGSIVNKPITRPIDVLEILLASIKTQP